MEFLNSLGLVQLSGWFPHSAPLVLGARVHLDLAHARDAPALLARADALLAQLVDVRLVGLDAHALRQGRRQQVAARRAPLRRLLGRPPPPLGLPAPPLLVRREGLWVPRCYPPILLKVERE